jgi:hypothetical protein
MCWYETIPIVSRLSAACSCPAACEFPLSVADQALLRQCGSKNNSICVLALVSSGWRCRLQSCGMEAVVMGKPAIKPNHRSPNAPSSRSGSLQGGSAQQPRLAGLASRVRVLHRPTHRLVPFGASAGLQSHRRRALPHVPGIAASGGQHHQPATRCRASTEIATQSRVLHLGFFQNGDIRVRVFPQGEEILVSGEGSEACCAQIG